jgi:hypothetical protein
MGKPNTPTLQHSVGFISGAGLFAFHDSLFILPEQFLLFRGFGRFSPGRVSKNIFFRVN